ncbi:specifically androgen-regulated gene protein isoform X2 [Triplophysa rosa]|uniref:specifically androgen-regulated gene protein isoform X2 n=1 Tax=Triplophysa rosa TaxID=992332 RepID=UPI002545E43F|nr:specifically androgen-regulated gene protein isoform X2 [Triplophysa rosa]
MPKSDSWPGGVSKEPVSGMNSTGSCDSMSDDSLEHLSAEEKACLMFLEETIESLDVEDDSGLSNDEPDRPSYGLARKLAQYPSVYHNKPEAHEDPNKIIGRGHRPSAKYLVPTPLVVAGGNAKLDSRPSELSPKDKPAVFIDGFRSASDHQQTPLAALKRSELSQSVIVKQSTGLSREVADLPPSFIPEPPVRSHASSNSPKSLDAKKQQKVSSEMSWIPPPSDFMDESADKAAPRYSAPPPPVIDELPEWTPELPNPAEVNKSKCIYPAPSRQSLSKNDIENLRQKALMKKTPLTPVMIVQHSGADVPRTPSPSSEQVPALPREYKDPKTPPPVAPKHKLPSNIILKSHKEPGAAHLLLSPSDRTPLDQQKIRMEALRKLGLLKNDDVDSGPSVSPSVSPTYKSKDLSPVSPHCPSVYSTSPTLEPPPDHSRFTGWPVSGDTQLPIDTRHRDVASRESLLKKPPPRPYEIKSSSLGRSGVGLSSIVVEPRTSATNLDTTDVELSPGQFRKSRARPLSVESAKDLSLGHPEVDFNKSFHSNSVSLAHTGGDAQKLPRSNGISVVITPHGRNGENRREALKKLGLLKDGGGR